MECRSEANGALPERGRLRSLHWAGVPATATRIVLLACLVGGCVSSPKQPPCITDPGALAAYEGQLVTLRGSLHILKFTTLLGVSVHPEPQRMAGALVEATGILRLWDVPASRISPFDVEGVSRTGRFFSLQDPEEPGHAVRVSPVVPDR